LFFPQKFLGKKCSLHKNDRMNKKPFNLKNTLDWSETLSIVEKNTNLMNQIKFISKSFESVISLYDSSNVVTRVCEKDFFINQPLLPVISTELQKYFEPFENSFTISITATPNQTHFLKALLLNL
jgi:hypothetical protein